MKYFFIPSHYSSWYQSSQPWGFCFFCHQGVCETLDEDHLRWH